MIRNAAGKPFFMIPNEKHTVNEFLGAVSAGNMESAKIYLSRKMHSRDILDLDRLREIVGENTGFAYVKGVPAPAGVPGGFDGICKRSVIINGSVLHLYMIKEPDSAGDWKIYGLENDGGND